MTQAARPGDVLADRYLLVDLLSESGNGRFWRAHDNILDRHVALHCIADVDRGETLMEAARLSATVHDRRLLRVLDADQREGVSYVVNEWGAGISLDILVTNEGPLPPRRAAWIVAEVAASLAAAHEARVTHGRLIPENVLIDQTGSVRVIGCCVDAALQGLTLGRISDDVTDLGGLLYFGLTGKWPGASLSAMPPAPHDHGRWLRPRQVRAGIPRVLDAICDEVLNPFDAAPSGHQVHTAAGLAQALHDYVGDPTGLVEAAPLNGVPGAGALAVPERRPPGRRPLPDRQQEPRPSEPPPGAEPQPGAEPRSEAEPEEPGPTMVGPAVPPEVVTPPVATPPTTTEPTPPGPGDQPTQAGMPIFDDEGDEVTWFSARNDPPPPPPPLEDPPAKPLFAPEPRDGGPVRRPRPGTGQPDYWPWDTATGAGTGSGVIPVTEDDPDDGVPGRSWFRLAALVGLSLLLLVAVVIAFNLGRGRSPLGAEPESDTPSSAQSPTRQATAPTPLDIASASALDPQGDPPDVENTELVPLAVDGDATTTWRTETYFQQFGPGGLKTGLGLVLDLGQTREVSEIELSTVGAPTRVSYYVADTEPTGVADLDPVTSVTLTEERLVTSLEQPASGRYVVVWLTALPAVDGGFRGEVAEVVVRG